MTIPPRFNVSSDQIDHIVKIFYAAIRQDDLLGPVFANHISDWPKHEEKISRFWRNVILFERNYNGNPMRAHMQAGDVKPEHFLPWLSLFDETLNRVLSQDTAAAWSELAHRIGAGLRIGVSDLRNNQSAPPILR